VRSVCVAAICIFEVADALLSAGGAVRRICFPLPAAGALRPAVLIVGGSFSGLHAQRELCGSCDVTLIDEKAFFEYTPGCLRLFVKPTYLTKIARPLPRARNGLVIGSLQSIEKSTVTVRAPGGEARVLHFDYLLLGCGTTYGCTPITPTAAAPTLEQRAAVWESAAAELRAAQSVLILGGGPVGVELAAEIVAAFPAKRVSLITAGPALCATLPPHVGAVSARWLRARGATVLLNSRATRVDERTVLLEDGSRLQADLVYSCLGGGVPNSAAVRSSLPASVDARGRVVVDKHLRVRGAGGRVLAMGDVMVLAGCSDLKLGHTAELNAQVAAANVLRTHAALAAARPEPRLEAYPFGAVGAAVAPRVFCVSLGEANGALAFNGVVISGVLAAVAKRIIEWTKVAACEERPVGILFWRFGDAAANWLSRAVLPPPEVRAAAAAKRVA